jgi:hypothetical protein
MVQAWVKKWRADPENHPTLREIARPNNDTPYIGCMLDLRKDPVILEMPAFDSKYVSLMGTACDHYVNVPLATRSGDFRELEKMLFHTARTEGDRHQTEKGLGNAAHAVQCADRVVAVSGRHQ